MDGLLSSKPMICFEVERVLDISSDGHYQVQWAPAWVSKFHLVGCEHLIQEFLQQQSQKLEDDDQQNISQESAELRNNYMHVDETCSEQSDHDLLQMEGGDQGSNNIQYFDGATSPAVCMDIHEGNVNESLRNYSNEEEKENDHSRELENVAIKMEPCEVSLIENSTPYTFLPNEIQNEIDDAGNTDYHRLTNERDKEHTNNHVNILSSTQASNDSTFTSSTNPPEASSYSCAQCSYSCSQKSWLTQHMRTHTHEKPFTCDICQKSFTQRCNLKRHQVTHTGDKRLKCIIIENEITNGENASDLTSTNESNKEYGENYTNIFPSTQVSNALTLTSETNPPEGLPFSCPQCTYSCSHKSWLTQHMRTHSGERPFSCDICGASFAQKCHVKRHQVIHTGNKRFKCNITKNENTDAENTSDLMSTNGSNKEYEENHPNMFPSIQVSNATTSKLSPPEGLPFSCPQCSYSCSRKSWLTQHMRTHSGERPFTCDICRASFAQKCHVKRHQLIHTRDKSFK